MVELLVYLGITSIALVVFLNFMVDVSRHAAVARASQGIQQNAQLILQRLSQEVRNASAIDTANTSFTDPGTLTVITPSGNHTFTVVAGQLRLDASAGAVALTSDNVTVIHFGLQNTTPSVTISLTLQSVGVSPMQTASYSTTLLPHRILYQ